MRGRGGEVRVATDEQPGTARPDKIPTLKPAFREGGTVTAANASSISDGAAALVLASRDAARAAGMPVRARIVGHSSHAQAPGLFTTAPVPAARKLLERIGWEAGEVDLWEVNEAFAVVPMAFMREMRLDPEVVNVAGGACALGHPIGASGARILVTLIHSLEARGLRRGVAAICIGGARPPRWRSSATDAVRGLRRPARAHREPRGGRGRCGVADGHSGLRAPLVGRPLRLDRFYRVAGPRMLKVGPYQGGHGCLVVPFGRGVCGTCAESGEAQVVDDVAAFPGHIACAATTRSEIVLPVRDGGGRLIGVLDIDSDRPAAFDGADARGLGAILRDTFGRLDPSARAPFDPTGDRLARPGIDDGARPT